MNYSPYNRLFSSIVDCQQGVMNYDPYIHLYNDGKMFLCETNYSPGLLARACS